MKVEFAVVTTKGQFVIPAKLRRKHGIRKGTRIAITEDDHRLVLQPINKEFIESLWGSWKGGPSASDFLMKERRREHALEERKFENRRARR